MLGLPYESRGAAVVFGLLAAAWVVSELVIRLRGWGSRGVRQDRGSLLVLSLCVWAGVYAAVQVAVRWEGGTLPLPWVWFVAGVFVTASGLLLRITAVRTLGRWFTTDVRIAADQTVVTDGPYRLLRHPSYTGLVLELGGIGLMQTDWLSLVCILAVPLPALLWRIRLEERALSKGLGSAYDAYATGRKRLVPGVW
jgi:protein-S-isoprenylcysteine O-methyltransferase